MNIQELHTTHHEKKGLYNVYFYLQFNHVSNDESLLHLCFFSLLSILMTEGSEPNRLGQTTLNSS
jgi:hypothetical protein